MPLTLNDLKREIAKFEEEWGGDTTIYDTELTIGGQRITEFKLHWWQDGSADYINLNLHPSSGLYYP